MIPKAYKPFIYGAISGVIFGLLLTLIMIGLADDMNNHQVFNKTVNITGKICPNKLLGTTIAKIQDQDDEIYFIDPEKCDEYQIGQIKNISYNRIHQPYSFAEFDYKRVTGKYSGWDA